MATATQIKFKVTQVERRFKIKCETPFRDRDSSHLYPQRPFKVVRIFLLDQEFLRNIFDWFEWADEMQLSLNCNKVFILNKNVDSRKSENS